MFGFDCKNDHEQKIIVGITYTWEASQMINHINSLNAKVATDGNFGL